jgi:hypothetical protein
MPKSRPIVRLALLVAAIASSPLSGQRHLPQTQIFESPGSLLLDTHVESPAVYSGGGAATRPRPGDRVEVQVFAPREAGRQIFEYSLRLLTATGLNAPFRIVSVKDWDEFEQVGRGPGSPAFSATRTAFSPLPRTGHVCTVILEPTSDQNDDSPIDVRLTLTVVSIPPRRVNRIVGQQRLNWM